MKTLYVLTLIVLISAGPLLGNTYTVDPYTFHSCQRDANSGDTIIMTPGVYRGQGYECGPTSCAVFTVIYPDGKDIVYMKDPNSSGDVILSGYHLLSVPPGYYDYQTPCQIVNGEGSDCKLIGLTIRCGIAPDEDVGERYPSGGGVGVLCKGSGPRIQDCNFVTVGLEQKYGSIGGIYIDHTIGQLVIQSCRITDCNAKGIYIQSCLPDNYGFCTVGATNVEINDCNLSGNPTMETSGVYVDMKVSISGGSVEINDCNISNWGSDGIYSLGRCQLKVADCNIKGNHFAGIETSGSTENVTITGCTIINNGDLYRTAGGGIFAGSAYGSSNMLTVRGCTLTGNKSGASGGMCITFNQATIEDCIITGNTAGDGGGGIYGTATPFVVKRCRIEDNTAGYGGGIYSVSYIDVNHCIIRGNVASGTYGGGISASDGGNIINCVISENQAGIDGGGIYLDVNVRDSNLFNCTIIGNHSVGGYGGGAWFGIETLYPIKVTNCIFWGNIADSGPNYHNQIYEAANPSRGFGELRNCDIQDTNTDSTYVYDDLVEPGNGNIIGKNLSGNIDLDPRLFADDYHISSTSPCINAGDNSVVSWAYDIDDQDRIVGPAVDIGADELNMPLPFCWWKFDEGTGTIAYDSAGNYNGQLMNGPAWNTGYINGGLSFDGIDDYVSVTDNPNLNITGDITISAWVWFAKGGTGQDGSEQVIVAKTVNNGAYNNPFDFRTGAAIEPELRLIRADASGHEAAYSTEPISIRQWHHVLVRVENNVPDFYVDGVVTDKTGPPFTITPTGNTNPLLIGRRDDGLYFNGVIDDVRVYNKALSAAEIWQLYWEGLSYKASNPNPADEKTNVETNVVLSWSPGKDAVTHDVYFGADFNEVNDANTASDVYMGNQDANWWDTSNYDSNGLDFGTTYYWRIDEHHSQGTAKGDVWSFTTTQIDPNLVGWWMLNEGTGTTASDSSGNGYNGAIAGATWFNDPVRGWCLNFDGINDYVSVANKAALNITGDITIAARVYFARAGEQSIVAKTLSNGRTNSPFDFRTTVGAQPPLTIVRSDANGHEVVYGTQPIPLNSWHHVLVRVQNKVVDFYIDGVVTGKNGTLTKTPTGNSRPLYIGRRDSGLYFKGRINDVMIFNRALTAAEVYQLYESGQ